MGGTEAAGDTDAARDVAAGDAPTDGTGAPEDTAAPDTSEPRRDAPGSGTVAVRRVVASAAEGVTVADRSGAVLSEPPAVATGSLEAGAEAGAVAVEAGAVGTVTVGMGCGDRVVGAAPRPGEGVARPSGGGNAEEAPDDGSVLVPLAAAASLAPPEETVSPARPSRCGTRAIETGPADG